MKYKTTGDRHFTEEGSVAGITSGFGGHCQGQDSKGESQWTRGLTRDGNDLAASSGEDVRDYKLLSNPFFCQEEATSFWKIVKLVFPQKPHAEPKSGIRSHRATALASVMSKCDIFSSSIGKRRRT